MSASKSCQSVSSTVSSMMSQSKRCSFMSASSNPSMMSQSKRCSSFSAGSTPSMMSASKGSSNGDSPSNMVKAPSTGGNVKQVWQPKCAKSTSKNRAQTNGLSVA